MSQYFLRLRRRGELPLEKRDTEAIFADETGTLKHMDPDGNVSNVAGEGSLPSPSSEGDVLTVVSGEWAGAAPSGGSQTVFHFSADVTAADILNFDTGVEIGPDPGAGNIIFPISAVVVFTAGETGYSTGSHPLLSTVDAFTDDSSAAWGECQFGFRDVDKVGPVQMVDDISGPAATNVVGQKLALCATTGYADGDGTAVIDVWYAIVAGPE